MSTERRAAERGAGPLFGPMSRKRRSLYGILLSLPLLVALVGLFSSCVTGSPLYLWKAAVGQAEILCNRKPIKEVLEEGDLDPEIRRKLELVLKVQGFARSELHLDTAKFGGKASKEKAYANTYVPSKSDRVDIVQLPNNINVISDKNKS